MTLRIIESMDTTRRVSFLFETIYMAKGSLRPDDFRNVIDAVTAELLAQITVILERRKHDNQTKKGYPPSRRAEDVASGLKAIIDTIA